jgi:hypothetical protein
MLNYLHQEFTPDHLCEIRKQSALGEAEEHVPELQERIVTVGG